MTKDDVPALLERTQQIMQDEYDKLNAEISSKCIKREWAAQRIADKNQFFISILFIYVLFRFYIVSCNFDL